MFVVRALTAVLTACALSLLLPLGPATAGGPTSAMLSVPGEGKTASLYYTDPAYDELAELVGATSPALSGKVDSSGRSHERGPGVTVTWLIHDVQPWRVDRIYLDGEGGPWIATQVMADETGSIWDSPVVWHQPTSGKALSMLLDELGVGAAARAADDFDGVAGASMPTGTEVGEAAAPAESTGASAVNGLRWGLAGLAGGVLLALAWMRVRSTPAGQTVVDDESADEHGVKDWLAPMPRS